jgi:antitoxin component YwqK of YwqJK toxin-antitoxin module
MRILITLLIFFSSAFVLAQNKGDNNCKTVTSTYDNGQLASSYTLCDGIMTDTLFNYDKRGRLISYFEYGKNQTITYRPIPFIQFYYSGASRKLTGFQEINKNGNSINVGVWKYYWKNNALMDSVVYSNSGEKLYRARFSKKGQLQFETTQNEKIVYNSDGTIRSHEKK